MSETERLRAELAEARVALALVSGALCDSALPVPEEARYGDAIRELTGIAEGRLGSLHQWADACREATARATAAESALAEARGALRERDAAIRWACGEQPDKNGRWFGDAADDATTDNGRRLYWWRPHLRRLSGIDAALARAGEQATPAAERRWCECERVKMYDHELSVEWNGTKHTRQRCDPTQPPGEQGKVHAAAECPFGAEAHPFMGEHGKELPAKQGKGGGEGGLALQACAALCSAAAVQLAPFRFVCPPAFDRAVRLAWDAILEWEKNHPAPAQPAEHPAGGAEEKP